MFNKSIIDKFSNQPTPFYYYDIDLLKRTLHGLVNAIPSENFIVHYAIKANSNDKILGIIKDFGLGSDCVSGNEIIKSLEVGFSPDKIAFAGVGKSDEEIRIALKHDIFCFNVESIQELEIINMIAADSNKIAKIALRINPNVNAKTHHYITTGLEENKFGINPWEFECIIEKLKKLNNLKLTGLHFHIGSQITDLEVFKSLCIRANEIQEWFIDKNFILDHINVGGGLGVNYKEPDSHNIPDFKAFFKVFSEFLKLLPGQQLHFELGRAIVAQSGALLSKVLYIKEGISTKFAILDAGMTELIRPALYQAYHKIENLTSDGKVEKYDVVGPVCESSDTFGKRVDLPNTKRGDIIAIRSTGAYGEVMSSNYNLRATVRALYSDEI